MVYILIFLSFLVPLLVILDPDFGWHVKLGELTLKNGFFYNDPLSYTMPGFPFVDHEWLTNVIFFFLNKTGGSHVLAIIMAAAAALSGIISVKGKSGKISAALLLTAAAANINYASINPQLLSWLLLSIYLWILEKIPNSKKHQLVLLLLTILWTNLHGSFALGIVLLFLTLVVRTFKNPGTKLQNLLFFVLIAASTFINPYGFYIWTEIYRQVTDTHLHQTLTEWQPAYLSINPYFLFLLAVSAALIFKFKNKLEPEKLTWFALLTGMSILSVRHIPLWTMVSVPLCLKALEIFAKSIKKKSSASKFEIAINVFLVASVSIFAFSFTSYLKGTASQLTEDNYYPAKALTHLMENPPKGNVFAPYEWGGYFDLNFPQKKVFIDGRMPSWRDHYKQNESSWAHQEYLSIISDKNSLEASVRKYDISTIIWFSPFKAGIPEVYRDFPRKIEQTGYFVKEYEDSNTVVFSKRNEFLGWIPRF